MCLDLYQPVGAGRRRRRRRKRGLAEEKGDGKGAAEIYLVRKEGLVKREDRRNFFPVKLKQEEEEKSTDFGDNVGVTVILPGGERNRANSSPW